MHEIVYGKFIEILGRYKSDWTSVLEVGTPKDKDDSLLFAPHLEGMNRIGIDLDGPYQVGGIDVLKDDATNLSFPYATFDLILCNSVLEHEPRFWLVLDELKRVLMPGGMLVIGVPAYCPDKKYRAGGAGTTTLLYHKFPEDYYRFSGAAVKEVFLSGLERADTLEGIMNPPRVIGWGWKPA